MDMEFTEREEKLIDQIHSNMVGRGIVDGEDEGIEKSELRILAWHLKQIHYQELSNALWNLAEEHAFEDIKKHNK